MDDLVGLARLTPAGENTGLSWSIAATTVSHQSRFSVHDDWSDGLEGDSYDPHTSLRAENSAWLTPMTGMPMNTML
jgi:hypothetical protein